jgi:hypothetical protein
VSTGRKEKARAAAHGIAISTPYGCAMQYRTVARRDKGSDGVTSFLESERVNAEKVLLALAPDELVE